MAKNQGKVNKKPETNMDPGPLSDLLSELESLQSQHEAKLPPSTQSPVFHEIAHNFIETNLEFGNCIKRLDNFNKRMGINRMNEPLPVVQEEYSSLTEALQHNITISQLHIKAFKQLLTSLESLG